MTEIRFLFGKKSVEVIDKVALNSWKVKDCEGNYFMACTANLWKSSRYNNKNKIESIREKREFKNPPNVRAVLAQVRREQRLRKKLKSILTAPNEVM